MTGRTAHSRLCRNGATDSYPRLIGRHTADRRERGDPPLLPSARLIWGWGGADMSTPISLTHRRTKRDKNSASPSSRGMVVKQSSQPESSTSSARYDCFAAAGGRVQRWLRLVSPRRTVSLRGELRGPAGRSRQASRMHFTLKTDIHECSVFVFGPET